jgi:hypothetical protein
METQSESAAPAEIVSEAEAEMAPAGAEAAPVVALAQVAGVIGPSADAAAIALRVMLTLPDGTQISATPDESGAFIFDGLQPGDYVVEATGLRILPLRTAFTLEAGQRVELPLPALYIGDTNGDGVIDVRDAALVAANFNAPALVPEADLDGNGWIDIRDLSLIGARFGLAGPLPWN